MTSLLVATTGLREPFFFLAQGILRRRPRLNPRRPKRYHRQHYRPHLISILLSPWSVPTLSRRRTHPDTTTTSARLPSATATQAQRNRTCPNRLFARVVSQPSQHRRHSQLCLTHSRHIHSAVYQSRILGQDAAQSRYVRFLCPPNLTPFHSYFPFLASAPRTAAAAVRYCRLLLPPLLCLPAGLSGSEGPGCP